MTITLKQFVAILFILMQSCVAQQIDWNTQIRNKPDVPHVPPYDYTTEISGKPTIPHAPPYNYNTELSNLPTIPHSPPYDWLTEISNRPTVPHVPPYDWNTEISNRPSLSSPPFDYNNDIINKPVDLSESDRFIWTATPGGTLTNGISNTVTLSLCPYGVSGTNNHFPVRISGGVGTAEAIEITGGTCTGNGTTGGTLVFTPANNHSGSWNIGTAIAGIKEMYYYYLSGGTTGKLKISKGVKSQYATLYIGDGTNTTQSTVNEPCLQGAGYGGGEDQSIPVTSGTKLDWVGPVGGTQVVIQGPIGHGCLEGMMLQGNGNTLIGLDIVHSYRFTYKDLAIIGWTSVGVRSMAVDFNFPAMVNGNNENLFEHVFSWSSYGNTTARAGLFGQGVPNVNSIFDFASNMFVNSFFRHDTGVGVELRFADANTFIMTNVFGGVASVLFTEVVMSTSFPQTNSFFNCHMIGQVSATANFKPAIKNFFLPIGEEGAQDLNSMSDFATGIAHRGDYFGHPKNIPLRHTTISASSAIASTTTETAFDKTYAIPPKIISEAGTVIRVRASGKYSTTGTPTLQLAIKIGTDSFAVIAPTTTASGAANYGWTIEGDLIITTIGASGTAQNGYANGSILGGAFSSAVWENGFTVNTTTTNTISVLAKWGTSSASNTITLETMTVEVLYTGHTN